jgi:Arc/MetJ-type ribon-helix-helix transcriptional regulator
MHNRLITVRLNDNLHKEIMIKYEGSLSELVRTLLREFIDKKPSAE